MAAHQEAWVWSLCLPSLLSLGPRALIQASESGAGTWGLLSRRDQSPGCSERCFLQRGRGRGATQLAWCHRRQTHAFRFLTTESKGATAGGDAQGQLQEEEPSGHGTLAWWREPAEWLVFR